MTKLTKKMQNSANFSEKGRRNLTKIWLTFCMWSGAKVCESCRSRKMLKNEYLDAKIGVDTEAVSYTHLTLPTNREE